MHARLLGSLCLDSRFFPTANVCCFIVSGLAVLIAVATEWCVLMQYDKDSDGHIDAEEFKFMCMDLGSPSPHSHNHSRQSSATRSQPQFESSIFENLDGGVTGWLRSPAVG